MAKFAYEGTGPDGRTVTGTVKAAGREEVELSLFQQQVRNVRITESTGFLSTEILAPRIKREDVMHLTRQLGAFIHAGLPLLDAVHMLAEESTNSSLRALLAGVEEGLRRGETLSDCLDRHPKTFPEFYRGILRSAELTGQLDVVLGQLAKYLERDLEARRRIKSASVYPAVIAVMSTFTVVVLAVYVMPKFKVFFKSMNAKLPLATRMLLAVTNFIGTWWWLLLIVMALLILGGALLVRTTPGRYAWDRVLLAIPVLGVTIRFALVERFCRMLASMASAGVPLPDALRVATQALRNTVFMRALGHVGEALMRGEGLARPLAAAQVFPGTATRMMRVGEETGSLDHQLEVTAQYYEGELDYKIKKLTSLFEPIVIVVMGGIVGFVAIALVSAMYGIFNQVHV
ncbi:MAG TPA: type II secretion system F family protein [Rugosimonospora sp.]|nr:type II secretion system F family protein [Rugosimonospora sp.]